MSISAKNNCLLQLESAFPYALWFAQEADKRVDNLGEVKNALQNSRSCAEAMCKYLVLDKFPNGEAILLGIDNGYIAGKGSSTRNTPIVLHTMIEVLYQHCIFDSSADANKLEKGDNGNFRTDYHRLRFMGNKGSHIELNEELNPSLDDCKKLVHLVLIPKIQWFYGEINMPIPTKIQNVIDKGVTENDLPKFSEWYSFKEKFNSFEDKTAQYILVVAPSFRKKLSDYDLETFAKASAKWGLIIDFDYETQLTGLERAFKKIDGKEKMRTITKGDTVVDFNGLYYFLAQGNSLSQIQTNPSRWEKEGLGYGKTLGMLLDKIKPRNKVYITVISNDAKFISKTLGVIYDKYSSIANKIDIAIITDTPINKVKIEEEISSEFPNTFGDVEYHLFDFYKLIHQGFALTQKNIEIAESEYVVPAYTKERKSTWITLSSQVYEDLKARNIELVHKNIGKERNIQESNFYLGDEITWQDLAWRGKGKDIERSKVTEPILGEIVELLQSSSKGFWVYKLNHEASAGGTTTAKRIAYEIGAKLPNSFPTILIHKYIPIETSKSIADLYDKTEDKTILAIVEEYKIGENVLEKLGLEIKDLQKKVVVLYVCRNNSSDEKEGKVRKLPSQLEKNEIGHFEDLFIELKPEKKVEIEAIKVGESRFQTPFIYGLTAFGKDFKKLDTYVDNVLDSVQANNKLQRFLGFIALIGRYTQNSIPESLFYNYLGIEGDYNVTLDIFEEKESIDKLFRFFEEPEGNTRVRCIIVRNQLFATEVSEKLLTSRNPENRHLWESNLKNWILELINIFKEAYPYGELYPLDKKLLDALFLDKENISDEEGKKKFSTLITQINTKSNGFEQSREILTALTKAFNIFAEDAFFSQHLARLYYFSAKNEFGLSREKKSYFFDEAIKNADIAINLYLQNPEKKQSLSGLYHTKGHAALLKLEFINSNFSSFSDDSSIEDTVKYLYQVSAAALEECLKLDENSTFGYGSYSYLIVQILDFGRKKSNYQKFIDFFEDEEYAWYRDKRDLGIEIVNKAISFWSKSNRKDDFQEIENKQSYSMNNKFGDIINRNYSRLLVFQDINKKTLLSKSKQAKTKELQTLWQNAYIDRVLGEKDFSNYNSGLTNLNSDELKEIVELLRTNLEYRPTLRDLKRWFKAVRINIFNIDIQTAINFLEFINKIITENYKQGNGDLLLRIEISYYLYCFYVIQIINSGQTIDSTKLDMQRKYNKICRDNAAILSLRARSSFEWLGNNLKNGFEQLVSREKLGDIVASRHNFFKDFSSLREVYGTIKIGSVGSEDTDRQTGKIEIDNSNLTAFFVPIHGGYIENADGTEEKCTFDNTNNNNLRVRFFIGFSYDGLRANQPIPENAVRANPNKKEIEGKLKNIHAETDHLKFKVTDVHKFHKKLYGKLEGSNQLVDISFEQGKTYDDYKYYRGQEISVIKDENEYKFTQ